MNKVEALNYAPLKILSTLKSARHFKETKYYLVSFVQIYHWEVCMVFRLVAKSCKHTAAQKASKDCSGVVHVLRGPGQTAVVWRYGHQLVQHKVQTHLPQMLLLH